MTYLLMTRWHSNHMVTAILLKQCQVVINTVSKIIHFKHVSKTRNANKYEVHTIL